MQTNVSKRPCLLVKRTKTKFVKKIEPGKHCPQGAAYIRRTLAVFCCAASFSIDNDYTRHMYPWEFWCNMNEDRWVDALLELHWWYTLNIIAVIYKVHLHGIFTWFEFRRVCFLVYGQWFARIQQVCVTCPTLVSPPVSEVTQTYLYTCIVLTKMQYSHKNVQVDELAVNWSLGRLSLYELLIDAYMFS